MDKIWVKDVKEGDRPKSVFLVARKATPTAKSGKTYLSVTFQDKTGELEARAFEKVEETAALFEEKDLVEVEGIVGTFQGKPQLKIESVAKVDAAALDAAEFVWVPPPEPKKPEKPAPSEADGRALERAARARRRDRRQARARSRHGVRARTRTSPQRLRRSAAAKSVHHAYAGGLLEHTVSCLKLAHRLADQYPQVDRDLLVAGAFFHDIGKIRELQGDRNVEYTDEGRLVGHLVMAAQWIHDKARRVGVPRELEHHDRPPGARAPRPARVRLAEGADDARGAPHALHRRARQPRELLAQPHGPRGRHASLDERRTTSTSSRSGAARSRPRRSRRRARPPSSSRPSSTCRAARARRPGPAAAEEAEGEAPSRAAPAPQPPAEAKPAEGATAAKPAEGAPARAERPPRPERPDRGPRGLGGPERRPAARAPAAPAGSATRSAGTMGPRLPGDRGPHRPPEKKEKALTHNPFAALAAKLEDAGKGRGDEPRAPEAAARPPARRRRRGRAGPGGRPRGRAAAPRPRRRRGRGRAETQPAE